VCTPPVRKIRNFVVYLVNLILKKISKIGAIRCQILRLKCTKIDFGCGFTPDPTGGAYSAPPDRLAVFKGPTSKGKEGEGEERREGKGEGKGMEGENDLTHPSQIRGYATGSAWHVGCQNVLGPLKFRPGWPGPAL